VVFFTQGLKTGSTWSIDEFSGWKSRSFLVYNTIYVYESGSGFAVYVNGNTYTFNQGDSGVAGGTLQFTWVNDVLTEIRVGQTTFSNLGSTTTGFFRGTSTQTAET